MEHVLKNINACERELELKVSKTELQKFRDDKLKEIAPKVDLKGFRKGKVPVHMVKKMFGEQIEQEAQVDCGNHFFQEITKAQKIAILSNPFFKDIKITDDGAEFVVIFETIPAFELCDYRSLTVKEPTHRVQEDEIELQFKNVLIANGTPKAADEVTSENFKVKVKYAVEDPEHPENNKVQNEAFELSLSDSRLPQDLVVLFVGKKVDDTVEYNPEGKSFISKYTIEAIEEIVPLEINEANIKTLTEDKFDNAEDFKQEIGFQLQEMWDEKSREAMEENLIDTLIDLHKFEVPNGFYRDNLVKYTINFYKQQKVELTEKDVLNDLPMFDKYFGDVVGKLVKWSFISDMISQKEKLELEESDIDEQVEQFSKQFPGIGAEQLRGILSSNEEFTATVLRKKLMDLLLDFSTTEEVNFEEFMTERTQKREMERIAKFSQIQEELKEETEKVEADKAE